MAIHRGEARLDSRTLISMPNQVWNGRNPGKVAPNQVWNGRNPGKVRRIRCGMAGTWER